LLAGCGGNDEDEIGMPTSELTPSVEKNREGILEADGWQIYIKRWQTIPDFLETKPEVETEVIEAVARNISGQTLDTRTFANLGLKITGQGRSYNTRNFVPTAYGEEFDEFEEYFWDEPFSLESGEHRKIPPGFALPLILVSTAPKTVAIEKPNLLSTDHGNMENGVSPRSIPYGEVIADLSKAQLIPEGAVNNYKNLGESLSARDYATITLTGPIVNPWDPEGTGVPKRYYQCISFDFENNSPETLRFSSDITDNVDLSIVVYLKDGRVIPAKKSQGGPFGFLFGKEVLPGTKENICFELSNTNVFPEGLFDLVDSVAVVVLKDQWAVWKLWPPNS